MPLHQILICLTIAQSFEIGCSIVGRYLSSLADTVQERVKNVLPEKLELCSTDGRIMVFTVNESRNLVLPFEDRTTQNADHTLGFFEDVLKSYGKSVENVLFFSDDNCSTNRKIANDLDLPLVGCASHRLNLTVNDLISDAVKTILDNATSWMSVMKMIERFMELVPHVTQTNRFSGRDISLVEQLDLNEVDRLIKRLKYFSEATNDLQSDSINLDDVRTYFNSKSLKHLLLGNHL
ncbi:46495_t:CDS:2 [Gigaspora margarita]|uniref:46495_t:CDS:1 n=1 Tax=Gigaspora margarita TaxID=4874 RepID=A0ABM8W6V1_GIGMA|nr:46495_t:CDS:2 [Gigaspora margarita]